jgi:hypothetical protein
MSPFLRWADVAIISRRQWSPDSAGEQALLEGLAGGLGRFAQDAANLIAVLAPKRDPSDRHPADVPPYRDTIHASTYLNGKRVAGEAIEARGFVPDLATLHSIVYTTSPIGPMLEITGARPHDIPTPVGGNRFVGGYIRTQHHPGFARRPHFTPGILAASAQAGESFKSGVRLSGKVK